MNDNEEMNADEELTVPEYVRRKIRAASFVIDSIDDDPRQREYAVMRDVLATVKRMRSKGASLDEINEALGAWSELTEWAMEHPATAPDDSRAGHNLATTTPSTLTPWRALLQVDDVPPAGIEPATRGLGNRCSLH
jgi:hypothetical protein